MEEVLEAYMVVDLNKDLEDLAYMCLLGYNFAEEDNLVAEVDNLVFVEDNLKVDNLVVVEDNLKVDNLVVVEDNLKVLVEYKFEHVDIFLHHQKNLIGNHHY
jgi:uncharacterized membrane protein YvbJ